MENEENGKKEFFIISYIKSFKEFIPTWIICVCMFFWVLIFPFIIAIVLLIIQTFQRRKIKEKLESISNDSNKADNELNKNDDDTKKNEEVYIKPIEEKKRRNKCSIVIYILYALVAVFFLLVFIVGGSEEKKSKNNVSEGTKKESEVIKQLKDKNAKLEESIHSHEEKEKQLIESSNSITKEYYEYKEKMKKYEEAEKEKEEHREAVGYDTGITYDQLARTPDDYIGEKVKFTGKVVQVMENNHSVQIRFAVNDDYDTILLGEYLPSIVSSRILEDDEITIYGTSEGIITYKSTLGGNITIPSVHIDQIDQ